MGLPTLAGQTALPVPAAGPLVPVRACAGPSAVVSGRPGCGIMGRSVLSVRLLAQGSEVIEATAIVLLPTVSKAVVSGTGVAALGALKQGC